MEKHENPPIALEEEELELGFRTRCRRYGVRYDGMRLQPDRLPVAPESKAEIEILHVEVEQLAPASGGFESGAPDEHGRSGHRQDLLAARERLAARDRQSDALVPGFPEIGEVESAAVQVIFGTPDQDEWADYRRIRMLVEDRHQTLHGVWPDDGIVVEEEVGVGSGQMGSAPGNSAVVRLAEPDRLLGDDPMNPLLRCEPGGKSLPAGVLEENDVQIDASAGKDASQAVFELLGVTVVNYDDANSGQCGRGNRSLIKSRRSFGLP